MDTLVNTDRLLSVLEALAADVKAGYQDQLEKSGHRATGNLIDSVTTEVEVRGTTYTVYLNLADYWKMVEHDTEPHWPPRQAILEWIRVKPVIPRPDAKGRIPTPQQLAFLISRAMAGESPRQAECKNPRGGTTGTHDLRRTEEAVIPFYTEAIAQALGDDLRAYIEAAWA